jgi:hypothetical protein
MTSATIRNGDKVVAMPRELRVANNHMKIVPLAPEVL